MDIRSLDDLRLEVSDRSGLKDVLSVLVTGVRELLGGDFISAWLHGSLATGDFEELSDVDFVVAVKENVGEDQVQVLQAFHQGLFDHASRWAWHLEGSYMPAACLEMLPPPRREVLYIDHGSTSFERSDHDHSLVVLWSLRERGVTLAGAPPYELIPPIPREALETEVRQTLRDWGRSILNDPEEMTQRWYQSFAVLSLCRMAQTLETGEIKSKRAGVVWAGTNIDPRWHALIAQAWSERARATEASHRRADDELLSRTRKFLVYMMELLTV